MAKAGAEGAAVKVVHISWLKRSDGELGGVEKFAHYLQRALFEAGHDCAIIGWSDYPKHRTARNMSNPDKALVLGSWLESEMEFDVAVSDGYWGHGITQHPVLPVVHGTWAQFHLNMGGSPWANHEVRAQHDAFNAPNAFPVACSPASARELLAHHRRQPVATILHGVDLEAFRPHCPEEGNNITGERTDKATCYPIVLHAATNAKKGQEIMPAIARELGAAFSVEYLNAKAGEEPDAFRRGHIFLHPSRHEGNAYALVEALASGLPVVTTNVGLFASIEDGLVGRVLPVGSTVSQWAAAVRDVWEVRWPELSKAARACAESTADFQTFAAKWVALLGHVIMGALKE